MKKKKTKKSGFSISAKLQFYLCILGTITFLLMCNWSYQVYKKPTEIIGFFDRYFHKSPKATWQNYGEIFKEKSTPVMTPDLLAALAQIESNGNPIVRTYWKWRWTTNIEQIYSPASSSVGMFQITKGTFDEAKQFCIKEGHVYRQAPGQSGVCWDNFTYSRMIPSHAIEMTSARLHYYTMQILKAAHYAHLPLARQQEVATIVHLCGAQRAQVFARAHFNARRLGKCGDHSPAAYLYRVKILQAKFRELGELPNTQIANRD
jgi:hypothetical protein